MWGGGGGGEDAEGEGRMRKGWGKEWVGEGRVHDLEEVKYSAVYIRSRFCKLHREKLTLCSLHLHHLGHILHHGSCGCELANHVGHV